MHTGGADAPAGRSAVLDPVHPPARIDLLWRLEDGGAAPSGRMDQQGAPRGGGTGMNKCGEGPLERIDMLNVDGM